MFGASNKSSAPAAQNPFKKSNTTLPKAEEKKTAEEPKKENPFTKVGAAQSKFNAKPKEEPKKAEPVAAKPVIEIKKEEPRASNADIPENKGTVNVGNLAAMFGGGGGTRSTMPV